MNTKTESPNLTQHRAIQVWSFILPILKCAVCPACLSIFGSLFAGARMGFLGDTRMHMGIIGAALVADIAILYAAMQHHQSRLPLVACSVGGTLALAGHFTHEAVEFVGFAILMFAAAYNYVLIRRHHREEGSCCSHLAVAQADGAGHSRGHGHGHD